MKRVEMRPLDEGVEMRPLDEETERYVREDAAGAEKWAREQVAALSGKMLEVREVIRKAQQELVQLESDELRATQVMIRAAVHARGPADFRVRGRAQDLHHYLAALCGEASSFEGEAEYTRGRLVEEARRVAGELGLIEIQKWLDIGRRAHAKAALDAVVAWAKGCGFDSYRGLTLEDAAKEELL